MTDRAERQTAAPPNYGRIAYQAHVKNIARIQRSDGIHAPLLPWSRLSDDIRASWRDAAAAVLEAQARHG